jgi:A/G-specific adenine glycosylase
MQLKKFSTLLLHWHLTENTRQMPWKGERDPYKVWLSEIILQQTRVEQGRSYYEKFIQKYPSVTALAGGKDEDIFKLWEGLGYYTRCKNLLYTARYIEKNNNGKFPETYEEIVALKGVGSYTAAALANAFRKNNILTIAISKTQVRMVTHLDVSSTMINETIEVINHL